ncbi:TPA: hypothetical protein N0F65_001675 [Lagenidium giganteum]|uniref:Protein kinase domain-containing protein n=1 Tax=Lagenidium giganteum TaxID=4803 RepID=A0AAV2YZI7_9STRA|nr:TPA: hypothetical protein N0F65_001675 [Lagenidium giganteum]
MIEAKRGMNFLKTLGGFVGGSSTGGLPYTTDQAADQSEDALATSSSLHGLPEFLLLSGRSRQDPTQVVSIFKSKALASQLTQNALRRTKTLRHPNILTYLDGIELPNSGPILIVTEPVVPLAQYLDELRAQYGSQSEEFALSVSWGLRSVLQALKFLNMDCKMLHGRLAPEAIFVTKGGDWKLGGFEMTGELTSDGPSYAYTAFEQYYDGNYKAPESQRREWKTIGSSPPFAVDMWAFACLMYYIFNDCQIRAGDLAQATNIPHAIRTHYRKALDGNPARRPSPDKMLTSSYFDTPFIKRMDFLENLAIKTPEEKAEYYKELCANLSSLPKSFGVHKVLPALKAVVEFGATGAKTGPVKLDPSASHMLPAMVQIGSMLPAEEFKEQVLPVLVKLFSCNDRAVRVQLLQMMEKFAVHFDAKLVNSAVVFDNICSGFSDASPVLRELTVKSMLHFADKLSDNNLNTRVMKYFAKLQTDPEPAIRTNTTICLGRIAPKLNEATRPKVLFPAFSKAMRDPFPHARMAGLRSMTACEEFFSPQEVAGNIIPSLAPLLLDVSVTVRDQAATSMNLFLKKVQDEAAEMKVREAEQAKQEKLKQAQAPASETNTAGDAQAAAGSSTGGYASALTGWASSAVASGVGRIVGASDSASGSAATTGGDSSQSSFQPTSKPSTATNDFAMDDDDDGWGAEDDDLDITSPKGLKATDFAKKPSSGQSVGLSVAGASSSLKLGQSTFQSAPKASSVSLSTAGAFGSRSQPASRQSASSALNAFAMDNDDDGWGDDDADLDILNTKSTSSATSKPSAFSFSSPAANVPLSTTTSAFGSSATAGGGSGPNSRTSSFNNTGSSSRTSSFNTTGPGASSTVNSGGSGTNSRTSSFGSKAADRKSEPTTKRLGAMKLEPKKKGDEWDNWDF